MKKCNHCGKEFVNTGKYEKVCEECLEEIRIKRKEKWKSCFNPTPYYLR